MTQPSSAQEDGSAIPTTRSTLDRSLVHGLAWTGAAKWASQVIRWGSTLVIARLLTPADYGLVGMAMVYLGFVQLVNEFGLSSSIIQKRDLTEEQVAGLGSVALVLGVLLFLVSFAAAPLIAVFFSEPAVSPVIMVLSTTFLLRAFQVVPRGSLNRDLRFRQLAWVDGTEAATQALVALTLALFGLDYWALVIGAVGAAFTSTVLCAVWGWHRIIWPKSWSSVSAAVSFGGAIAISRVAWYVYSNADFAIVGRLLGKAALGAYSFGWTLANIPVERVSALVGRVTPGVFAAVQNEPHELRRYVLALTEGLALVTFPASVGLALVASDFVHVVLGSQWESAIAPLRLLCFYGGFRSVTTLLPQVLVATGQARRNAQISILMAVVLPVLFIVGTRWGTSGVAMAWLIGFPAVILPFYALIALRTVHATMRDYLRALWPATSGCLAMAAAVLGIHRLTGSSMAPPVRLGVQVGVGAVSYVGVVFALHRSRLGAFRALLRQIRKR